MLKGNNTISSVLKGSIKISKILFNNNVVWKKSLLPDGYTECEYLQAVNDSYIFVPVTIKDTSVFKIRVKPLTNDASFVIGMTYNGDYFSGVQLKYQGGGFQGRWGNNPWTIYKTISVNEIYDIVYKNGELTINDEIITFNKTNIGVEGTDYLGIFARQYKNKPDSAIGNMQIFSLELDDTMNLIPALDQNGKPCMYDTVTKKTFYNQGTGEFLYKIKEIQ